MCEHNQKSTDCQDCCHAKGQPCSDSSCDKKECSHSQGKPCGDSDCKKQECAHSQGKPCGDDDCKKQECSHSQGKPCGDDDCKKQECSHSQGKPCGDDDCKKQECSHSQGKPCGDDNCKKQECCHSQGKPCGDDKCNKDDCRKSSNNTNTNTNTNTNVDINNRTNNESTNINRNDNRYNNQQSVNNRTNVNNNQQSVNNRTNINNNQQRVSNQQTTLNQQQTSYNQQRTNNQVINNDQQYNTTTENISNVTNESNATGVSNVINSVGNVIQKDSNVIGGVVNLASAAMYNTRRNQTTQAVTQQTQLASDTDRQTTINAQYNNVQDAQANISNESQGLSDNLSGDISNVGIDLSVKFYHASYFSQFQYDFLIEVNQLLRGIDCSNSFFDGACGEIFDSRPQIIFDSIERTEIAAHVQKGTFSTRFTNAKLHDFRVGFNIPFAPYSLSYLNDEYSKGEEESSSYCMAIFRNMYHARVTIRSETGRLSARLISEIDEALAACDQDAQAKALTKVFNFYGHVWASKVYLGGKLYTHQDDISVAKGSEEHAKKELYSRFTASVYGNVAGQGASGSGKAAVEENTAGSMDLHARGGDPHLFQQPGRWMDSARNWETWRVIEFAELRPLYTLLDEKRRNLIEMILYKPKSAPLPPKGIRHRLEIELATHHANYQYPFTVKYGDNSDDITNLRDEAHRGDGIHVLVLTRPGIWEYRVFDVHTETEASDLRTYLGNLPLGAFAAVTETWGIDRAVEGPRAQTEVARNHIFAGLCEHLGADVVKHDLVNSVGTHHGWVFIGYKGLQSPKGMKIKRSKDMTIEISVEGDRFLHVTTTAEKKHFVEWDLQVWQAQETAWVKATAEKLKGMVTAGGHEVVTAGGHEVVRTRGEHGEEIVYRVKETIKTETKTERVVKH